MTLNRYRLREQIKDEYTITRILDKARKFNIIFDGMSVNKAGSIVPAVMFDKGEWIKAQKKFISTLRIDCVETNTRLLNLMSNVK